MVAEHLKFGGDNLITILTWLMNSILKNEVIPNHYKRGLIVPIPKPGKDTCLKDNNRGITLLTILYKLLENILIDRERAWFNRKDVTDDLQGAGQTNCSCIHTSMLVQETVAYNRNKGSVVHVAFLDTRKAFDTVWVEGLLYKLYKLGFNLKTWNLIKDGYNNFECAAYIGGTTGEWFVPKRGVHQGAPFSMNLYQVFINDLLRKLKENRFGVGIGNIDVTCPTSADDVAIIALYKKCMNNIGNSP